MANPLLDKLRSKDKKGLFNASGANVSYATGIAPFDYRNGYMVEVRDFDDKLVDAYESIGLAGGNFVTIVGESGTAKTTFVIQSAWNIVKDFPAGMIMHYDVEQALTLTRIRNISKASTAELMDKYVLKQSENYIDDILEAVVEIAEMKRANFDDFKYDTGLRDEFNRPIIALQPTVVIMDSIPMLQVKGDAAFEMEGQTAGGRKALALSQFYTKLAPIIKSANIIVIAINHKKDKPQMGFNVTKAQLMYMKNDKSMPGGKAPIYLAHNVVYFEQVGGKEGKYNEEENGFNGFKVRATFWKSRTNVANKYCTLIYNQETGFDSALTLYELALENNLIEGRNPAKYFPGQKEVFTFDDRKLMEYIHRPEMMKSLYTATTPVLKDMLSTLSTEEIEKLQESLIQSEEM